RGAAGTPPTTTRGRFRRSAGRRRVRDRGPWRRPCGGWSSARWYRDAGPSPPPPNWARRLALTTCTWPSASGDESVAHALRAQKVGDPDEGRDDRAQQIALRGGIEVRLDGGDLARDQQVE